MAGNLQRTVGSRQNSGALLVSSQPRAVGLMPQADQSAAFAHIDSVQSSTPVAAPIRPPTTLVVTPSLHAGAADSGAVQLVRVLASAGHRPIVVSSGGRMLGDVIAAGATFVPMMEPTHLREFHHRAELRGLNGPGLRGVLV